MWADVGLSGWIRVYRGQWASRSRHKRAEPRPRSGHIRVPRGLPPGPRARLQSVRPSNRRVMLDFIIMAHLRAAFSGAIPGPAHHFRPDRDNRTLASHEVAGHPPKKHSVLKGRPDRPAGPATSADLLRNVGRVPDSALCTPHSEFEHLRSGSSAESRHLKIRTQRMRRSAPASRDCYAKVRRAGSASARRMQPGPTRSGPTPTARVRTGSTRPC